MLCHSVRPGYDFAGQNLNFSGQLSDDRYTQPWKRDTNKGVVKTS